MADPQDINEQIDENDAPQDIELQDTSALNTNPGLQDPSGLSDGGDAQALQDYTKDVKSDSAVDMYNGDDDSTASPEGDDQEE